ncbi:hypothetical protein DPV73_07800 [Leptospira mayottensis]|nr:hypothetical protein DPV73_07800 [Leptospira mayottensis]
MPLEKTQRLASIAARKNSASRFYCRSKKLSVSLLLPLEKTQRLASIAARQVRYWLKGTSDSMVQ